MRYVSTPDARWLYRQAGLVRSALPPPSRTAPSRQYVLNRYRGLGAANSSIWSGPPVGAGAGAGAATGAAQGAALGTTIMPGIGTAIGAIVGAIGGAIAGAINKMDPEQHNFDQAIALWQQNPSAVFNIRNKYLALAGFFDLTQNQAGKIRIYRKYGRMGEQRFVNDLMGLVLNAAQSGQISPGDNAISVYNKIVLPWEDSWGFGPEPPNPHSGFMDNLLTGMIWDYTLGNQKNWTARSGDYPFANLPPFTLAQVQSAPSPALVPRGIPTAAVSQSSYNITPTVSSTPPNIGAPISYAKDNVTGAMVSIPDGGTYAGLTPYGGWLIQYGASAPQGAGVYVVKNGTVVPYYSTSAASTAGGIPTGYTLTSQTALVGGVTLPLYSDANSNLYVWQNGQMVPYSAAVASSVVASSGGGGGGGGYYPGSAPQSVETNAPIALAPATGGIDSNTLLMVGGGLALLLLARRKSS